MDLGWLPGCTMVKANENRALDKVPCGSRGGSAPVLLVPHGYGKHDGRP